LGMFDAMAALTVARNIGELYSTVLVETPLAPYFRECLSQNGDDDGKERIELDEVNLELIRNTLHRAYLEDFYRFAKEECDGETSDTLAAILEFEADRRTLSVAINTLGTEIGRQDRLRLFPRFGPLWNSGMAPRMARVDDASQLRSLIESETMGNYRPFLDAAFQQSSSASHEKASFASSDGRSLEEVFFEKEVELCQEAMLVHFTLTPFYGYFKLKEQEIRNIIWIAECIAQQQKQNIHHYINAA